MGSILVFLILLFWCYFIAKKAQEHKKSFWGWFIMSFLFSPIVMTVALFIVIESKK